MKAKYLACLSLVPLALGCGKTVDFQGEDELCGPDRMVTWKFVQPQPDLNRTVDLLFVVDTSTSLREERGKISTVLPSFVNALPNGTDYRVGVMLAHGGASSWSGRLYSPAGIPTVLSSATMSSSQIQSALTTTLATELDDADVANGEMMMFSAQRALRSDRMSESKAKGFFRDHAALSVVLLSDENDQCFLPQDHGFTTFPDFVAGDGEVTAYRRHCLDATGTPRITPASTLAAFRAFKSGGRLSWGTITHVDPARVPAGGQDAIGHGQLELVRSTLDGVVMEISDPSYSEGLAKLGDVVSSQLRLQTLFRLSNANRIETATLRVRVDGNPVDSQYQAESQSFQIRVKDAGTAGSIVEAKACKL